MAQTYKQLVTQLEAFIVKALDNDLILEIVKFSATQKDITKAMKEKNDTSDEHIANLFTNLILPIKPTPAKITWPTKEDRLKDTTKYPLQWAGQMRSYNLDYRFWMKVEDDPNHKMKDFFDFLKLFAEAGETKWDKFKEVFGGNDQKGAAVKLFTDLIAMSKVEGTKALFFEELAKSANISKLIYMYIAHYTSAIAIMYHDAIFGYLILSNYWNDGAIYGQKIIQSATDKIINQKYDYWRDVIPDFPEKSRKLIQAGYDELANNAELSGATVYKSNRLNQLYGPGTSSDIKMLVIINEKFNINCDGGYDASNSTDYRAKLAGHYKSFKITIPD